MVVLLYASVIVYDLNTEPSGLSKKTKILYFSFLLVSFVVLALYALGVPIPSPSQAITQALDALLAL